MTFLEQLETVAKERGHALGVATALPVTIDIVIEWSRDLESRGVILVPASALINDQTS